MKILSVLILLCGAAFAQSAVVVELKPSDAAQARALYDAKVAADAAWEKFTGKIADEHKEVANGEFSKDFRFIVPKVVAWSGPGIGCWPTAVNVATTPGWGNLTLTAPENPNPQFGGGLIGVITP